MLFFLFLSLLLLLHIRFSGSVFQLSYLYPEGPCVFVLLLLLFIALKYYLQVSLDSSLIQLIYPTVYLRNHHLLAPESLWCPAHKSSPAALVTSLPIGFSSLLSSPW